MNRLCSAPIFAAHKQSENFLSPSNPAAKANSYRKLHRPDRRTTSTIFARISLLSLQSTIRYPSAADRSLRFLSIHSDRCALLVPSSSSSLDKSIPNYEILTNSKAFFKNRIAPVLNLSSPDDFYSLKTIKLAELFDSPALSSLPSIEMRFLIYHYKNSLIQAAQDVFPEFAWHPWRFQEAAGGALPHGFWKSWDMRRKFFDWISSRLANKQGGNFEDCWYSVSRKQLYELGAKIVLSHYYKDSIIQALKDLYPSHIWLEWRFKGGVSNSFWQKKESRRNFFDWASQRLKVSKMEDWYSIKRKQIADLGGYGLLNKYYKDSLILALKDVYPEFDWKVWRFSNGVTQGFWKEKENRRQFMEWARKELNIEKMEDWYSIKGTPFRELRSASGLLNNYYNSSLADCLKDLYPEFDWQQWRFSNGASQEFWSKQENRRKFMAWAEKELDIQKPEDWTKVDPKQLSELAGRGVLVSQIYGNSIKNALLDAFPEKEGIWRRAWVVSS